MVEISHGAAQILYENGALRRRVPIGMRKGYIRKEDYGKNYKKK